MSRINRNNTKRILACATWMLLLFMVQGFGQSGSGSLRGTVTDATGGVLPGVTVSATNVGTGVGQTTLTDNSGIYTFQSLPAGTYAVSAALDGFQTANVTDVDLTVAAQANLDVELQVAQLAVELEVTTSAQDILTESSSSTGTVLPPRQITELPLTSNDVLELINIMGGVVPATDPLFSRDTQSFAGMDSHNINLQQDGISINEVRYNSGIASPSRVNTEMVSEFKMILSPVDAEMGRGMGQVQILTKSGANQFHGSGVWNIQNSSLDSREWEIARQNETADWRNMNTYTLTFSGPIVKNKTFFFASWDHAIPRSKVMVDAHMLTPCAQKGIFRYFTGWDNGAYDSTITSDMFGASTSRPVVDVNGVPLDPRFAGQVAGLTGDTQIISAHPDGTPYGAGEGLQYTSVFGPLTDNARALIEMDLVNCSYYEPDLVAFDRSDPMSAGSLSSLGITGYYEVDGWTQLTPNRIPDTDFIPRLTEMANQYGITSYRAGDGLNRAAYRWTRTDKGSDTVYGVGEDNRRKNFTVKLDHNFNDRHRASGTYTYESSGGDDAKIVWPDGFGGDVLRKPQRFSVSLTSSLRPTLLNEARFGLSRTVTHTLNALDTPGVEEGAREVLRDLLPTDGWVDRDGRPYPDDFYMVVMAPYGFTPGNSHPIGARGTMISSWGGTDNRWTLADTLTWTKGKHSFKFGGEARLVRSEQDSRGPISFYTELVVPSAQPDYNANYSDMPTDLTSSAIPGLVGMDFYMDAYDFTTGTLSKIRQLRDYHAGTIGHINQWFYVNDPVETQWNDFWAGEQERVLDMRQKEMAFFFKDDWKVTNSLTLNLGLRYEYFGVPHLANGMTLGLEGGAGSLFGISGKDFSTWMPEAPVDYGTVMQQTFIGPGSQNPDQLVFEKDYNNFGPAVGFSWQVPWFGKGKTTLRGGYQLNYVPIANADPTFGFIRVLGGATGATYNYNMYSTPETKYMRIADLEDYLPISHFIPESISPLNVTPIESKGRSGPVSQYDPDIRNPYIHSLNMSLTRNLSSSVTLDLRYVGTLARKSVGTININAANWISNGLIDDFNAARRGDTTDRLDRLFEGVQFREFDWSTFGYNYYQVGDAAGTTGGDLLRTLYAENLANGDYNAIAGDLNVYNYEVDTSPWAPMNAGLPVPGDLTQGALLRHANTLYPGMFPENFIVANPQVGSDMMAGDPGWISNINQNNYHSMQAQLTVRPTRGFNLTSTYTWSRNLGWQSYTNPNDRRNPFDYTFTSNHRAHQLSTYGSWELPFGANGFFFRDLSSPVLRRIVEGWQLSWILNLASGRPTDLAAGATHLYGNSVPHLVNPDLFDPKDGKVTWDSGAREGRFFGDKYVRYADPQCFDSNLVDPGIQGNCTMNALYIVSLDEEGNQIYDESTLVFQQPLPGEYGNFGRNKLSGPGSFGLDMAMSKNITLTEGKIMSIRVDAGNILNHPSPTGSFGGFTGSMQTNARETSVVLPNLSLASGDAFGAFLAKAQHRTFQAKISLRF